MKHKFLYIAAVSFAAAVVEVALLYLMRTRGDIGFKVKITPDIDWF